MEMDLAWIKLVEYGEYPHEEGIQVLNLAAGEEMSRRFRSVRLRLVRRFAAVPIYIGHPDDPKFAQKIGHKDTQAYAWVQDIEAREDGIWIKARWTEVGQKMIEREFFKYLSPRWKMKEIADKRFQPVQLLSIGLTNQPNILNKTIQESLEVADDNVIINTTKCNSDDSENIISESDNLENKITEIQIQTLKHKEQILYTIEQKLGIDTSDNFISEKSIFEKLDQLLNDAKHWNEEGISLAQIHQDTQKEVDRFYKLSCVQQEKIERLAAEIQLLKEKEEELFFENAISKGYISPADVDEWKDKYRENPDIAKEEICKQKININTISRTENLSKFAVTQKELIVQKVKERMLSTDESYTEAWNAIKQQMPSYF